MDVKELLKLKKDPEFDKKIALGFAERHKKREAEQSKVQKDHEDFNLERRYTI